MEAQLIQRIQPCTWFNAEDAVKMPKGFVRVPQMAKQKRGVNMFMAMQPNRRAPARAALKVSSSLKNFQGSVLGSGGLPASLDESLVLRNKSREIEPLLNGRCIYLVGMMGSGKTTIGRILSEVLAYSFVDCDALIEEKVGGMSVADIFKHHGESYFRERESEVLEKLSMMHKVVISTGGGAVIRPVNWKHMRRGISVWLDVPVDCLARRISAVGTGSRPLLHGESEDAYSKAFQRLSMLFKRGARHMAMPVPEFLWKGLQQN